MRIFLYLIVTLVGLSAGATRAGPYENAELALKNGKFDTAMKIVRPLAERGEARAQELLGFMYGKGQGVSKNFVTGCMWLNLAAFQLGQSTEDACVKITDALTPEQWLQWIRPTWWTAPNDHTSAEANTCDGAANAKPCARIARYNAMQSDILVSSEKQLLIESVVQNQSQTARQVLIIASGTVDPQGSVHARVQILLDNRPVGSAPTFDWRISPDPAAHSFSAAAMVSLTPGDHTISLAAGLLKSNSRAAFRVTAGTNISVLTSTAKQMQVSSLTKNTQPFSTKGRGIPVFPFLTFKNPVHGPSALLLSANAYGNGGDAMMGITLDGASCPWSGDQNWSVNDIVDHAERQAPFFVAALSTDTSATNPAGAASVFPWPLQNLVDPVRYQIASGAMFISIEHPHILGAGYNSEFRNRPCNTSMYRCIASTEGYSFCPNIGERSTIASAEVNIDEKSDGVLMIIATTVPTADHNDKGGTVYLGLRIDGVDVGSVGMQELPLISVESARTLTASYLADNEHKLAPGRHLIESWMYAEEGSSFKWISVPKELSILFFD